MCFDYGGFVKIIFRKIIYETKYICENESFAMIIHFSKHVQKSLYLFFRENLL